MGLFAKMYSMVVKKDGENEEKKTVKGIKKSVTKRDIRHEDYKNKLPQQHSMVQIRSKEHQLQTIQLTKTSLSPYDDKRFLLEDGCTTLAHGHYRI